MQRDNSVQEYLENQKEAYSILFGAGIITKENNIWQILQAHFDTGIYYSEIFFKNLTVQEIVDIVSDYVQINGVIAGEIICDLNFDLELNNNNLEKAIIKFNGSVWHVHKNDKDTFPSNPHAHNYEENIKLHLGNGAIYSKKRFLSNMKRKDLIYFRKLLSAKRSEISLPILEI